MSPCLFHFHAFDVRNVLRIDEVRSRDREGGFPVGMQLHVDSDEQPSGAGTIAHEQKQIY